MPEPPPDLAGLFPFRDGEVLRAARLNEAFEALLRRIVKLESKLAVERSKWCHHCGAPWDWSRPTCKWCATSRPPDD